MADYILLDEWHVSFRIPNDRDDAAYDAIGRILDLRQFRKAFRRALRAIVRPYRERAPVRVRLSVGPTPKHPLHKTPFTLPSSRRGW